MMGSRDMPAADVFRITVDSLFGDQYEKYINNRGRDEFLRMIKQDIYLGHARPFTKEEVDSFHRHFREDAEIFVQTLEYVRISPDSTRAEWRRVVLNAAINGYRTNENADTVYPPDERACTILLGHLLLLARNHNINQ